MTRPFVWLLLLLFALPTVAEPEAADQTEPTPIDAATPGEHDQDTVSESDASTAVAAVEGEGAEGSTADVPPSIIDATNFTKFTLKPIWRPPPTPRAPKIPSTTPTTAATTEEVTEDSDEPDSEQPEEQTMNPHFESSLEKQKDTAPTGKRADLTSCFEKANTVCFVGDGCRVAALANSHHSRIIELDKAMKEAARSDVTKKNALSHCNVGAIFTRIARGKYAFEYHTSQENFYRPVVLNNTEIRFDEENLELFCEPACKVKLSMAHSIREGDQPYLTGEMDLYELNGSGGESEADRMPLAVHKDESSSKEEKKKARREDSNLGKWILIGCGTLLGCIILAVIVVLMIHSHQTAKNSRRREAIEAAQTIRANARSSEKTTKRERERLLANTRTASTSVSAVAPPSSDVEEE